MPKSLRSTNAVTRTIRCSVCYKQFKGDPTKVTFLLTLHEKHVHNVYKTTTDIKNTETVIGLERKPIIKVIKDFDEPHLHTRHKTSDIN